MLHFQHICLIANTGFLHGLQKAKPVQGFFKMLMLHEIFHYFAKAKGQVIHL